MKRNLSRAAILIGTYGLCIALASALWQRPFTLSASYVVISILMLYRWHSPSDLTFYFVAFALGPIAEMAPIHFGAWAYSKPLFLVPLWLPLLWGIASLFMKKISEAVASAA